jgi:hypothetical protein
MPDTSNADNILNGVDTAWKILTKLVPTIGVNPLASVVYTLFTFGIKTSFEIYDQWKKKVLLTPITVPEINVPPDPDIVKRYLNSNEDYKEAFKEELADFENNDIFLGDAYIALHHLEESPSLKEVFQHLIESKNYRAYVSIYKQLSITVSAQQDIYSNLRVALNAINADKESKDALDNLFKTITDNVNNQLIKDDNFWNNLNKIIEGKK